MKKVVGLIINLFIFSLGLGLLFLTLSKNTELTNTLVDIYIMEYKVAALLGVVLMVLPIIYFIMSVNSMVTKKTTISFETTEGKVSISNSAITDFVERICSNYTEVSHSHSEAVPSAKSRGDIVISVNMDILGGTNIPETVERLQQNIKRQLGELLGLENIESVSVNISNIISNDTETEEGI
ncbi:MAG: alkaline shock response membrane anchor protein AmaP [Candidatus Aureabacteria bacterium]|nr:alkaline shock response membrane anchor protein AmaP [Candidatus Auribacterota bacterium]